MMPLRFRLLRRFRCRQTNHRIIPAEDTYLLHHLTYSCACGRAWVTRVAWERAFEDLLSGGFDEVA